MGRTSNARRGAPGSLFRRCRPLAVVIGISILGLPWTAHGEDPPQPAQPPLTDPATEAALARERDRARQADERRNTPEAREARQASRNAYRNVSARDARELARQKFPDLFSGTLWRGAQVRPGERIEHYTGDFAYVLRTRDAKNVLVESQVPLRVPDGSGKKVPIETTLETRGASLAPRHAFGETRIPQTASEAISLERAGIKLTLANAAGSPAVADEDKAFYANALTDTDLITAAMPNGVQMMLQLRSEVSPSEAGLDLELPPGASLRPSPDPNGGAPRPGGAGAEIVKEGKPVATITAPLAWDSDGEQVPAAYELDGDRLTLKVDHRGGDWAYPIMVDPYVWDNFPWWENPTWQDWSYWGWGASQSGFLLVGGNFLYGNGLYIGATSNNGAGREYWGGQRGHVLYLARRGSTIVRVDWNHFGHLTPQGATAVLGYITGPGGGIAPNSSWFYRTDGIGGGGYFTSCVEHPNCTAGTAVYPSNWAVFALEMRYGWAWITSDHWGYLGSPQVGQWEGWTPSVLDISNLAGSWAPADWVDNASGTFNVDATDTGLGVKRVSFDTPAPRQTREHGCEGHRYSECPNSRTTFGSFSYDTSGWPEGPRDTEVWAQDIVDNTSGTGGASFWRTVKVDHTPPTVSVPPDSAVRSGANLDTGVHPLKVNANDVGSNPQGAQNSGVKAIRWWVDGIEQTRATPNCSSGPCSTTFYVNTTPAGLPEGSHTIEVSAEDGVTPTPLSSPRLSFEFVVDRSPPTLTLSGPLKDAPDGVVGEGIHTLTAEANDDRGQIRGSGVNSLEFFVDGGPHPAADPACSGAATCRRTLNLDTGRLDAGLHEIKVVAKDRLDHPVEETIRIDVLPRLGERSSNYTFDDQSLTEKIFVRVNVANGNAVLRNRDWDFASSQIDLGFDRYQNLLWSGHDGDFGNRATAVLGREVRLRSRSDGSRVVQLGDGSAFLFTRASDGTYVGPLAADLSLTADGDGSYTLRFEDTDVSYRFVNDRLVAVTDEEGTHLDLSYKADGSIDRITDGSGGVTLFQTDTRGQITQITRGTKTYTYTYGGPGNRYLIDFVDPDLGTTHYDYDLNNRLKRITAPGNTIMKFDYDDRGRVTSVVRVTEPTTETGPTTTFTYNTDNTVVTDPDGRRMTYFYGADLSVSRTTADPLPADYADCLRATQGREPQTESETYCQTFNRDDEPDVIPMGSIYDPVEALTLPLDFTPCYDIYGIGAPECVTDPPIEDDVGASGFGPGGGGATTFVSSTLQFGVADNSGFEKVLDDPKFTALNAKRFRVIVPYNVVDTQKCRRDEIGGQLVTTCPNQDFMTRFIDFYRQARREGVQVMVSFGKRKDLSTERNRTFLPKRRVYLKRVRAFRRKFPRVAYYAAWNETNHQSQPPSGDNKPNRGGPHAGARFTHAIQTDLCHDGSCRVVAGDFADHPTSYYVPYREDLRTRDRESGLSLPAKWGIHPHGSVLDATSADGSCTPPPQTPSLNDFYANVVPPGANVWFTEAGAFRADYGTTPQTQVQGVRYLVDRLARAADGHPAAERLYYYYWWEEGGEPHSFMTALIFHMNNEPTPADSPATPAYEEYRARTNGQQPPVCENP